MNLSDWKEFKLTELGTLARGKSKHRPRDAAFLYGGIYPFIQTGDVKNSNHKIYSYSQTYSDAGLAQSKLWPENTIAITIAANIAETGILTFPACFPDSILGFIPDTSKCDVDFIEYLLQHYKKQIQTHSIGSVQENINLGTFERVKFHIPPISEQKRIASILSNLDEKIELNRQTAQTLEAIAQAIFKEWFVDFNFPGATGEMQESKLGEIPKGWRVGNLGELLSFKNGKSSPERNYEFSFPVYGANGIIGYSEVFNCQPKTIIVGRVGSYCGVVYYTIEKSFVTENAILAEPKNDYSSLYCYYKLLSLNLNNHKSGSGQPLLNQTILSSIVVAIPDSSIIMQFEKATLTLIFQIKQNEQQTKILTQLRDSLLPKLMKGEVNH